MKIQAFQKIIRKAFFFSTHDLHKKSFFGLFVELLITFFMVLVFYRWFSSFLTARKWSVFCPLFIAKKCFLYDFFAKNQKLFVFLQNKFKSNMR